MTSTHRTPRQFNSNLRVIIILLSLVIIVRLWGAGMNYDNMKGFWISSLHVVIVSLGAFYALRRSPKEE